MCPRDGRFLLPKREISAAGFVDPRPTWDPCPGCGWKVGDPEPAGMVEPDPTPASWEDALLRQLAPLGVIPAAPARVHLAYMLDPWMRRIESGEKRIESRWAMNQVAPFDRVDRDDVVLFKRSGGLVAGWASVDCASSQAITPERARALVARLPALGVDPGFADLVAHKRWVTLVWLREFHALDPKTAGNLKIDKRDRRGWVILRGSD